MFELILMPATNFQMMAGLECGHLYCTSCWTEYLTMKIVDEGASQMIECPVRMEKKLSEIYWIFLAILKEFILLLIVGETITFCLIL